VWIEGLIVLSDRLTLWTEELLEWLTLWTEGLTLWSEELLEWTKWLCDKLFVELFATLKVTDADSSSHLVPLCIARPMHMIGFDDVTLTYDLPSEYIRVNVPVIDIVE
jgi:hypothetical protein